MHRNGLVINTSQVEKDFDLREAEVDLRQFLDGKLVELLIKKSTLLWILKEDFSNIPPLPQRLMS